MPADRATCEADIPGSKDAATSCSFSDRDHRRRRSTGRTSDRAIVITKLLELLLGLSRSDLPNKAVPGVCVRTKRPTGKLIMIAAITAITNDTCANKSVVPQ